MYWRIALFSKKLNLQLFIIMKFKFSISWLAKRRYYYSCKINNLKLNLTAKNAYILKTIMDYVYYYDPKYLSDESELHISYIISHSPHVYIMMGFNNNKVFKIKDDYCLMKFLVDSINWELIESQKYDLDNFKKSKFPIPFVKYNIKNKNTRQTIWDLYSAEKYNIGKLSIKKLI